MSPPNQHVPMTSLSLHQISWNRSWVSHNQSKSHTKEPSNGQSITAHTLRAWSLPARLSHHAYPTHLLPRWWPALTCQGAEASRPNRNSKHEHHAPTGSCDHGASPIYNLPTARAVLTVEARRRSQTLSGTLAYITPKCQPHNPHLKRIAIFPDSKGLVQGSSAVRPHHPRPGLAQDIYPRVIGDSVAT